MGTDQQTELQIEQNRVIEIINEITSQMVMIQEKGGTIGQDVKEILDTFWNDVTVNLCEADDVIDTHTSIRQHAELLSERERSHGQILQLMKTLTKLKYSPYFGRVDFLEENEKQSDTIYIGIASLMDKEEQNFLIYDWRAPISSMYYDFSPGPAQYQTPSGLITGEMELKRQFIIKNGLLTGMFETGVTIRDEMLQAVLGNNADTQMKSIVATIQKEQNQIIRNERSQIVVVQGVAGSGKTSAALQRVAYLLYRHRDTLSPENIVLFSPNPLFNSYISTVLPELGEENMKQSTFQEYLHQRLSKKDQLEDSFDQLEYMLTAPKDQHYQARVASIQYKNSLKFKNVIDIHVGNLAKQGLVFKNLSFRKKIIVSKDQIYQYFYNLDQSFTIPNRLQLVKEWLFKELKKRTKLEMKKSWVEEEIQFLDKDDFIDAFQKLEEGGHYSEKSFDDFDREQELLAEMLVKKKFKPLFNQIKNLQFVNMKAVYLNIFTQKIAETPDDWKEICELTISSFQNKTIMYEDATPFVYLQDLIVGKQGSSSIRHIFIDEAQDYSPFQFAFIKSMFPYSKMTLLGDINQAIYSHANGASFSLAENIEQTDSTETYVLTRTYRSTRPIVEFTSPLVKDGDKIEPFNRDGNIPTARIAQNQQEILYHVKEQLLKYKRTGHNTIAVICKTAKESHQTFDSLKEFETVRLIEKGTITFETGVVVIPAYLAKGIEFDAVIIYDSSQYTLESERKLFYTACTRAMHDLHIETMEHFSPLMTDVPSDKYSLI